MKLLQSLFEQLGLNPNTGEGSYAAKQTETLRQSLRDNDALTRYITFKLGLSVNSQLPDTAFINKILRKLLGLKIKRIMVREGEQRHWQYGIEPASMAALKHYHTMKFASTMSP